MAKINEDGTVGRGPAGGETSGGDLQGTLTTTYGRLAAVFGPPDAGADPDAYYDPDEDQVRYEWLIDTPDGPAYVHDWKTGEHDLRKTDEPYEWRIGGRSFAVVGWIQQSVKSG